MKPKIARDSLGWMCFSRGCIGTGATPLDAYSRWYASRCLFA